jgi:hypothetical protein
MKVKHSIGAGSITLWVDARCTRVMGPALGNNTVGVIATFSGQDYQVLQSRKGARVSPTVLPSLHLKAMSQIVRCVVSGLRESAVAL